MSLSSIDFLQILKGLAHTERINRSIDGLQEVYTAGYEKACYLFERMLGNRKPSNPAIPSMFARMHDGNSISQEAKLSLMSMQNEDVQEVHKQFKSLLERKDVHPLAGAWITSVIEYIEFMLRSRYWKQETKNMQQCKKCRKPIL